VSQEIKERGCCSERPQNKAKKKQQRSNPDWGCKTIIEKLLKAKTQGA